MKTIINLVSTLALIAVLAFVGIVTWYAKWTENYVNNMTVLQSAEMYYHTNIVRDMTAEQLLAVKFQNHVFELIGLD